MTIKREYTRVSWIIFCVCVMCCGTHSSSPRSQLHCLFHAAFYQFIQAGRGENANLFHTAITSHHDVDPTLLQCPSALAVKMSDELFSSEGNPIWFTLPPLPQLRHCLLRAMFHLNIKACEKVARHFKCHFLGFSRGMWLLKCSWRRDLITETMLPLSWQGDSNLYLSSLCFVDYTITEEGHLHLSVQLF